MPKTICELKVELKAKGIKGITGLNKKELEALLKGGSKESPKASPKAKPTPAPKEAPKPAPKEAPKAPPKPATPKPFKPAPTKGESPKTAEKPINKKAPATPKPPPAPAKPKPPPKPTPPPKLSEEVEFNRFDLMKELPKCKGYFKKANITSDEELKRYIVTNHPDRKTYKNKEEEELYKEISNCYTVVRGLSKGGPLKNIY
jgi:hypothetical protein